MPERLPLLVALGASLLVLACAPAAPAARPAATPAAMSASAATAATTPPASAAPAAPMASREPTLLRVSDLQITSSAGNYLADAKGYFAEEGIRVEFVRVNTPDILPLLVAGQIEVAAGTISSGLFNAFARGVPAKIVADHGANLANASAGSIVFRRDLYDAGVVRGPADFKGRKIGMGTTGSAPEISLDKYLRSGGLTVDDIDAVLLSLPDFAQAFENKVIDAAQFQEPFTTVAVERGLIVRGPIGYEQYPNQQIGAILFGERLLGDRALGVRYLRAYVRGVRDYVRAMIERDPAAFDEVAPILMERTTVKDRALLEKAVPSGLRADPLPNVQSLTEDQDWYVARGLVGQRINVAEFVDTSLVEQAIRELGR